MERRTFIKSACLTCVSSLGAVWLLEACTSNKYITNFKLENKKLIVSKADFITVKKGKTITQKFILIKPDSLEFPIAIYLMADYSYKALLLKCTHQGCELSAFETTMVCPCHGAEFNSKGEVTQGPADVSLQSYSTSHDKDFIYVEL